jgi:alkaline phosphatase D
VNSPINLETENDIMRQHTVFLATLLLALIAPLVLRAQHDPQRNATQGIAVGDFKKVDRELAKADSDDPETQFVRMMAALKQGDVPAAEQAAQAALDAGLPFARLMAGPRRLLAPLYETESYKRWAATEGELKLLHGPMVGAVTDTSASFWVRTAKAARVQIKIDGRMSDIVATSRDTDFSAVATIDGLAPATRHDYQVFIDGKPVAAENTQFSTFPARGAAAQFAVAFGGGAGYVPERERMWDTIGGVDPIALLMLGDNVYIDQPEHALCQNYCYYRRQARPEWRRLTASTSTFAIYDDHDFGTNDCVPGPEIESPPWKRTVWNRFRENWVNPAYGGGQQQPGCWFDFTIGDVHFIMLDGRYYRDHQGGSMLGPVQKAWLFETLKGSRGTFKVLASPVPWTAGIKPGSKDPWDGFPAEREEIFSFTEANNIEGLFLIAADRHRTDLRITERPQGYDLYEFESSRLTNRHTHGIVKTPGLIWGYNKTCSFGLMRFDTTRDHPSVTFECITIDGDVTHRYELQASALKH